MLTRLLILVTALALSVAGWQGFTASRRASQIAELSKVVEDQKTALRGYESQTKALTKRLQVANARTKERARAEQADQRAIQAHPEWASQPVPAAVLERLRDD